MPARSLRSLAARSEYGDCRSRARDDRVPWRVHGARRRKSPSFAVVRLVHAPSLTCVFVFARVRSCTQGGARNEQAKGSSLFSGSRRVGGAHVLTSASREPAVAPLPAVEAQRARSVGDCADVEMGGGRARLRVFGRGAHARDPRRPAARPVRRDQPRDLHVDHRHRARRHRPRGLARREARGSLRPAAAARRHRVPRRCACAAHRADRPRARRRVGQGRARGDAAPHVHGVLPARGRAQRRHADGREAATPRPPPHRRCGRTFERHLDLRCAGRHLRDRIRADHDHADAHDDLRARRLADRRRARARVLAVAARADRPARARGGRRGSGGPGREHARPVPDRERVLLHPRRARSRSAERTDPPARRHSPQLRRPRRPDRPAVPLRDLVRVRDRGRVPRPPRARRAAHRRWRIHAARATSRPSTRARGASCSRSTPRS